MRKIYAIVLGMLCWTDAFPNQPIDTAYSVRIGGISQWISVKGKDTSLPLLLWLHGGPGGSDMAYAKKFSGKLNKHFIFVEWDQRESGRTAVLNRSKEFSLDQVHQDVFEMIYYLRQRFNKSKIFLAGNSWGGFLALHAARQYPQLLAACILVSPSIYFHESEEMSLREVKAEAIRRNNTLALTETDSIKFPFQSPSDLWLLRKWMYIFHGEKLSKALPPEKLFLNLVTTWFAVIKEWETYNSFNEIKKIDCPIAFLLGKKDFITHPEIARRFYDQLEAEKKHLYWFDTGHMIITQQPGLMQDVIIDQLSQ